MSLTTGVFFGTADMDAIPAVLMRQEDERFAHVFVFDADRGPRQVRARVLASEDELQPTDQMIFIPDSD